MLMPPMRCGKVLSKLRHAARTNQRRCHPLIPKHPGQRQLGEQLPAGSAVLPHRLPPDG